MQEPHDANKLLDVLPPVHAFTDDKILFLTSTKLAPRKLVVGRGADLRPVALQPAAVRRDQRPAQRTDARDVKALARYAMQEVGHAFGLHHCLDPRCAMYAQWTPSYPPGEAIFCTFCREQSEQKIRQTKS